MEKEGEKLQCMVASQMPPTGDLAHNPGMCPDWESNQRPFDLQANAQPLSHTSQGNNRLLIEVFWGSKFIFGFLTVQGISTPNPCVV